MWYVSFLEVEVRRKSLFYQLLFTSVGFDIACYSCMLSHSHYTDYWRKLFLADYRHNRALLSDLTIHWLTFVDLTVIDIHWLTFVDLTVIDMT